MPRMEGKRKRGRSGCNNCRKKRKKCDESRPACTRCLKGREDCSYTTLFRFRHGRASVQLQEGVLESAAESQQSGASRPASSSATDVQSMDEKTASSPVTAPFVPAESKTAAVTKIYDSQTERICTDLFQAQASYLPPEGMDVDLTNTSSLSANGSYFSPASVTDDGVFLPGSTYQALHSAFRNHAFMTARVDSSRHLLSSSSDIALLSSLNGLDDDGPVELNSQQEYRLWKAWVDEIASWLDKFDRDANFQHTIPVLAHESPHLRYAMLALSARYLEKTPESFPADLSLALYQKAIHLLLPRMYTKDIAVVASCVILCVLEMFSCNPKAWRRHLDGCASLIQAMNIRGDSGGLEEAIFWCFVRMDLCGGLISSEKTLVPIEKWTSHDDVQAALSSFNSTRPEASHSFHDQAKLACYLTAAVIEFLCTWRVSDVSTSFHSANLRHNETYSTEWKQLFGAFESWFANRVGEMLPLVSLKATSTYPTSNTFPTILYGNSAAIAGSQFAHTGAILMLQHKPHSLASLKTRSILWHARQICGIAISNEHHGCWTNSVQPLWIAGRLMSHPAEHASILEVLEKIERITGWSTRWRIEDLRACWGDLDDD